MIITSFILCRLFQKKSKQGKRFVIVLNFVNWVAYLFQEMVWQ